MTESAYSAPLRIATRESRLALWQANHVAELLRARHPAAGVALLGMTTRGDQILDRPLAEIGGKGLFTKELEVALFDGRADGPARRFRPGGSDDAGRCARCLREHPVCLAG